MQKKGPNSVGPFQLVIIGRLHIRRRCASLGCCRRFFGGSELFLLRGAGGAEGRDGDLGGVCAASVAGILTAVLDLFDRAARFVLHDRCKGVSS